MAYKRPFWTYVSMEGANRYASPVFSAFGVRTFNGLRSELSFQWAPFPLSKRRGVRLTYHKGVGADTYYVGHILRRRGHVLAVELWEADQYGHPIRSRGHFDALMFDDGKGTFTIEGRALGDHRP